MSGYDFSNIFQTSNLNKNITTTASSQATFARHVTDHCGSKRESPDFHALRRDSAHPSRLLSNMTIGLLSTCIFPEKQGMKEKSRLTIAL